MGATSEHHVLDRELLDAAADRLLGGMTIDLDAAHQRAERLTRQRRRRAVTTTVSTLIAAAAAVLVVAAGVVPGVRLPDPAPARAPSGPGALPGTVRLPARWEPSATQSPLTRVAYALFEVESNEGRQSGHPVWLVGADDGAYRWLPSEDPQQVTLSADGRQVAWREPSPHTSFPDQPVADVVQVLDVPSGRIRSLELPGLHGRGIAVAGTAISPSGRQLAVWGVDRSSSGDQQVHRLLTADLGPPGSRRAIGQPVQVCVCGDAFSSAEYGYRADDVLVGPGAQTAPKSPVPGWGPLGGLVDVAPPMLLAPDGRSRWAVEELPEDEPAPNLFPFRLVSSTGTSIGLGTHNSVAGLAVTNRGVLVSRWSLGAVNGGPADVVLAGADGVRPVTRVVSPSIRVVGVASSVAAGGRVVAGTTQQARVLDLHWYGWCVRQAVGWVAGWPSWLLIGLALTMVLALREQLLRLVRRVVPLGLPRALPRRLPRAAGVVLAVAAAAGVVLIVMSLLRPSVAERPAPVPGGGPVLPAVIADQKLHPPRAYEAEGRPVTRRLTMLFVGSVADRGGVYGLDAATGALVQVDDRPVGSQDAGSSSTFGLWSLSPNGRYVSTPKGVLDLQTARLRRIDDLKKLEVLAEARAAVLDDGTMVTPASNRARSVAIYAPGKATRTLEGVSTRGTFSVEGQTGGRVLLRFFLAGGSGNNRRADDRLSGVLDPRTGRVTDIVATEGQNMVLAVTADGAVVDSNGTAFRPGSNGVIIIKRTPLAADAPTIDRLTVSANDTVVAVGSGTTSPTGVLVRDPGATDWRQAAQLRLPGLQKVDLAADLIATAVAQR